jgi:hypothetical protein
MAAFQRLPAILSRQRDDGFGSFSTELGCPCHVRVTPGGNRGEDILDRRLHATGRRCRERRYRDPSAGLRQCGTDIAGLGPNHAASPYLLHGVGEPTGNPRYCKCRCKCLFGDATRIKKQG